MEHWENSPLRPFHGATSITGYAFREALTIHFGKTAWDFNDLHVSSFKGGVNGLQKLYQLIIYLLDEHIFHWDGFYPAVIQAIFDFCQVATPLLLKLVSQHEKPAPGKASAADHGEVLVIFHFLFIFILVYLISHSDYIPSSDSEQERREADADENLRNSYERMKRAAGENPFGRVQFPSYVSATPVHHLSLYS